MKKNVIFLLIFIVELFLINGDSHAQELKTGFLDVQQVLNESKAGKRAKDSLESFIRSKQKKIDEKGNAVEVEKKKLKSMKVELIKKSEVGPPIFSSDARRKMEAEIQNKEEDIQKLVRNFKRIASDAQEEVKRKEAKLTEEMLLEIRKIIKIYGKAEGYTVIFQNTDGLVLYVDESQDLTDAIIKKYDASKK